MPDRLIEPFAGGATVSLTAAFENLTVNGSTMIELDPTVAATWYVILNGQADWLAKRILEFDLTPENVRAQLEMQAPPLHELGFTTLLRNRVSHGGILAPGSGVLKHGEAGKGIRSRWYPKTLGQRIMDIAQMAHRIEFTCGDGMQFLHHNASRPDAVWFIDPPYTAGKNGKRAGTRLYTHYLLDHERLFSVTDTLVGDFLMTYDNAPEVQELADRHGFDTEPVSMKGTHLSDRTELLIGRDLNWARR
jgi:DNA adenine methylase